MTFVGWPVHTQYDRQVQALEEEVAKQTARADKLAALTKGTAAADVKREADAELRKVREFYQQKLKNRDGTADAEKLRVARQEHAAQVASLKAQVADLRKRLRLQGGVSSPGLAWGDNDDTTAGSNADTGAGAGAGAGASASAAELRAEVDRLTEENVELRKFVLAGPPPPPASPSPAQPQASPRDAGMDDEARAAYEARLEELKAQLHLANARVAALRKQQQEREAQQQPSQAGGSSGSGGGNADDTGSGAALSALDHAADVARLEDRLDRAQQDLAAERAVRGECALADACAVVCLWRVFATARMRGDSVVVVPTARCAACCQYHGGVPSATRGG